MKKYVPEDWHPKNWNEVISVILEIVEEGKVDKEKLTMEKEGKAE